MGVAPWVHHLPPLGLFTPAARPANHYRAELRRRDASRRASLSIIICELTLAQERLRVALRQLEQGRLV